MKAALLTLAAACFMVVAIVWGNSALNNRPHPPPPPGYDPREQARDQCIKANLQQMRGHTDAPYTAAWNMCDAVLDMRARGETH